MISVISKSGNLAPYLKATTQVVASGLRPAATAVTQPKESVVAHPGTPSSSHSLGKVLPRGPISVVSGPAGTAPPHSRTLFKSPVDRGAPLVGQKIRLLCYYISRWGMPLRLCALSCIVILYSRRRV